MKVVIVEDELAASENLAYLLHNINSDIEILKVLDSVKSSVEFLSKYHEAELIFMDIHLADGVSFEIFDQVTINIPVIFTTAYNQYALKAFKFNSIDYLLKPIDTDELSDALEQFKVQNKQNGIADHQIKGLIDLVGKKDKIYKSTFLVHHRDEMIPLKTEKIAYFRIDDGIVKGVSFENKSYSMDSKLEDLEEELDPDQFYRANRQFIINREAIVNIKQYFNSKLIVVVDPVCDERIVVSKAKALGFKTWLDS
ncbi:LytR/AlgR family response regulator transcription factor [Allomuricauda sp. F6463D]|uniref:LytR/AlgR family response regulator transcription factor n=1 Tax=Allomuricauda sp. F6463D TaxID=2926409 RepID=UPI001FF2CB4D|nr:LytTR family DNA-binding domain-containing protein [Muricauda sp. F6463D]MCK0159162.1 LytTR family DNA-binding domain-containing protein [Muricauda sp. F6463D]